MKTWVILASGLAVALAFGAAFGGCQEAQAQRSGEAALPAPITVRSAFAEAGKHGSAAGPGQEVPGIHNLRRLGDHIYSGSEPHGEAAFKTLAELGVKTVLSVDGKVPDEKMAAKYGLRYVHVPIKYKEITPSEALRMAKTFRELDGPFFVHCFHGRHRGPASAMVGRMVLDGISRGQALAEMRACGTAERYEGLFQSVASLRLPTEAETEAFSWDFPAAAPLGSFAQSMVVMTRHYDHLKALAARDWVADPEHPDVDARNEAEKLAGLLARCTASGEVEAKSEDFRDGMRDSLDAVNELVAHLEAGETARERAKKALRNVKQSCNSCHVAFRN